MISARLVHPPKRLAADILMLAGALLLVRSPDAAAAPMFEAPFLVADADLAGGKTLMGYLDADAVPDLVVSTFVLRGNGDGTFTRLQAVPYGGVGPITTALGNLNGDVGEDLVVMDPSNITIFLNNGDGTFGPQLTMSGGGHTVALGDVNGDSNLDLVWVSGYGASSLLTTRLGNGDGTFSAFVNSIAAATAPWGLALTDLNGDARLDALVSATNGTLSVYRGNGNGSFESPTDYPTGPIATFVATGDVNQDSREDVISVCGDANSVRLYLGNGDGTLTPAADLAEPIGWATSALVADFDQDDTPDLVVAAGTEVLFLRGHGDGTFDAAGAFDVQVSAAQMAAGDLDSDGRLDLVWGVSVLLGRGNGAFGTTHRFASGPAPADLVVADLNHDSRPDVVTVDSGSDSISVLLGTGAVAFAARVSYAAAALPVRLAVADLNADTHPDIVTANQTAGSVSVLLGVGDGQFLPHQDHAAGSAPVGVATGDVNADGKPDLAVANISSKSISILLGVGNGTFMPDQEYATAATNPHSVALGDLNSDGKLDLVAPAISVTGSLSTPKLVVLLGNGDGTFQGATTFNSVVGCSSPGCMDVALSDFNSDNHLDVAVTGEDPSRGVSILAGLGNGQFQIPATVVYANAMGWDIQAVDFDNDGRLDITTTSLNSIAVLFGSGTGTFPTRLAFGCGQTPRGVGFAPLSGAGLDLIAANRASSQVAVLPRMANLVGVGSGPEPTALSIRGFPNPTRVSWSVSFDVTTAGRVSLRVYDIAGRQVRTLVDGPLPPGSHTSGWDLRDSLGRRVAPGLYLWALRSQGATVHRRLVVLP